MLQAPWNVPSWGAWHALVISGYFTISLANRRANRTASACHILICSLVRCVIMTSDLAWRMPHSAYVTPWSLHLRLSALGSFDISIALMKAPTIGTPFSSDAAHKYPVTWLLV